MVVDANSSDIIVYVTMVEMSKSAFKSALGMMFLTLSVWQPIQSDTSTGNSQRDVLFYSPQQ